MIDVCQLLIIGAVRVNRLTTMVINTLTALFSFVATLFGPLPQAVSR